MNNWAVAWALIGGPLLRFSKEFYDVALKLHLVLGGEFKKNGEELTLSLPQLPPVPSSVDYDFIRGLLEAGGSFGDDNLFLPLQPSFGEKVEAFLRSEGFSFSHRRITVSTCGLVDKLNSLGEWTKRFRLAISLNAADNETRNRLMPVNQRFPIEKLLASCRVITLRNRERVTFEYILLKGMNDSLKDAKTLARLLAPLKAKVNLIPFNEHPELSFKRPDHQHIVDFVDFLQQHNLTVMTRRSKGADISAACGQLRAAEAAG